MVDFQIPPKKKSSKPQNGCASMRPTCSRLRPPKGHGVASRGAFEASAELLRKTTTSQRPNGLQRFKTSALQTAHIHSELLSVQPDSLLEEAILRFISSRKSDTEPPNCMRLVRHVWTSQRKVKW